LWTDEKHEKIFRQSEKKGGGCSFIYMGKRTADGEAGGKKALGNTASG
jgi:hypothetical protein